LLLKEAPCEQGDKIFNNFSMFQNKNCFIKKGTEVLIGSMLTIIIV